MNPEDADDLAWRVGMYLQKFAGIVQSTPSYAPPLSELNEEERNELWKYLEDLEYVIPGAFKEQAWMVMMNPGIYTSMQNELWERIRRQVVKDLDALILAEYLRG